MARALSSPQRALILDEIQKIPRWSEAVKGLWDEDRAQRFPLKVILLASAAILIEKGVSENLTGRFEMNYFPHWTFAECHKAFQITLADYARIGGYPKCYDLRDDSERLESYIQDGIIERSIIGDFFSCIIHNCRLL